MTDEQARSRAPTREALVLLVFMALACIMTWPLLVTGTAVVDMGEYDQLHTALFIQLALDWVQGVRERLFDVPYFFPYPMAWATNDPGLGVTWATAPFMPFTSNPLRWVNLAEVVSFALCGHAGFLLSRRLTGLSHAGWITGLAFAFCQFRYCQLDHAAILQMQWLVYALWQLHRLQSCPTPRHSLVLALLLTLHGLSSSGVVICSFLLFPWVFAWLLATAPSTGKRRFAVAALTAAALSAAALAPYFLNYVEATQVWGLNHDVEDVLRHSARVEHLWSVPPFNALYGGVLPEVRGEGAAFLGLVVLCLCGVALASARRSERSAHWMVLCYGGLGILYTLISFGPQVHHHGEVLCPGAWNLLVHIPGFSSVRTPARMFMVTSLCVAVLAGLGAARVLSRCGSQGLQRVTTGLLAALILAESWSVPLPLREMPTLEQAPWYTQWLAANPRPGAVVELPVHPPFEHFRMYFSTVHRRPLVNGMGAFHPPTAYALKPAGFQQGLAGASLARLKTAGLRYIVFEQAWVPEEDTPLYQQAFDRLGATPVAQHDTTVILEVPEEPTPEALGPQHVSLEAQRTVSGEHLRISLRVQAPSDRGIFEPRTRAMRVQLLTEDGSVQEVPLNFSPPLVARGESLSMSTQLPVPARMNGTVRLLNEQGEVWAVAWP